MTLTIPYIDAAGRLRSRPLPEGWAIADATDQASASAAIKRMRRASIQILRLVPLSGPVDIDDINRRLGGCFIVTGLEFVDWVIVGGTDKPVHPDWVRSLRDQCVAAGVPFFFTGWGEFLPLSQALQDDDCQVGKYDWMYNLGDHDDAARVGKRAAGRLLDGRTWDQIPEAL
jgi:protein gp37